MMNITEPRNKLFTQGGQPCVCFHVVFSLCRNICAEFQIQGKHLPWLSFSFVFSNNTTGWTPWHSFHEPVHSPTRTPQGMLRKQPGNIRTNYLPMINSCLHLCVRLPPKHSQGALKRRVLRHLIIGRDVRTKLPKMMPIPMWQREKPAVPDVCLPHAHSFPATGRSPRLLGLSSPFMQG